MGYESEMSSSPTHSKLRELRFHIGSEVQSAGKGEHTAQFVCVDEHDGLLW